MWCLMHFIKKEKRMDYILFILVFSKEYKIVWIYSPSNLNYMTQTPTPTPTLTHTHTHTHTHTRAHTHTHRERERERECNSDYSFYVLITVYTDWAFCNRPSRACVVFFSDSYCKYLSEYPFTSIMSFHIPWALVLVKLEFSFFCCNVYRVWYF